MESVAFLSKIEVFYNDGPTYLYTTFLNTPWTVENEILNAWAEKCFPFPPVPFSEVHKTGSNETLIFLS